MQDLIYKELLNIADNRNIEIIERDFKSSIKGLYGQDKDIKVIALDKKLADDPIERNFILAHELGHEKLHQGKISEALYFNNEDTSYKDKLEDEANNYAYTLIKHIKQGIL